MAGKTFERCGTTAPTYISTLPRLGHISFFFFMCPPSLGSAGPTAAPLTRAPRPVHEPRVADPDLVHTMGTQILSFFFFLVLVSDEDRRGSSTTTCAYIGIERMLGGDSNTSDTVCLSYSPQTRQ